MTWSRLLPGAALVIAVGAAGWTSRSAVLAGHWAYLALVCVAGAIGVALLIWSLGGKPAPGAVRAGFRWAAAAAGVGLAVITYWLSPYEADPVPPEVPGVSVRSDADGILMLPDEARRSGVAFIPGALVDPRAYQRILTPVVQAGYPVYIAKPPLGLAFGVPDVVAAASAAEPLVEDWVVAGHSLGGAVASGQTDGAVGLILLGAYPIDDVSDAQVPVLSISGSNDTLTTPADVDASRQTLPADARFVVIDGGIHAYFGDYGVQRGDGQPTVSRQEAQDQTQRAVLNFLGRIF
jgi:hypothetical protein